MQLQTQTELLILADMRKDLASWKRENCKYSSYDTYYLVKGKIKIRLMEVASYSNNPVRYAVLEAPEGSTTLTDAIFSIIEDDRIRREKERLDRQYLAVKKELS